MATFRITGVDALLDDLRTLECLPNEVVDDILNAQADVLVRAQRAEIQRQWNGPYSIRISARSIKKNNKINRAGNPYIDVYPQGERKRAGKKTRNAEIAFLNEYGAPDREIESRPALRDAIVKAGDRIMKAGEKVYHAYLDSKNL